MILESLLISQDVRGICMEAVASALQIVVDLKGGDYEDKLEDAKNLIESTGYKVIGHTRMGSKYGMGDAVRFSLEGDSDNVKENLLHKVTKKFRARLL